MDQELFSLPEYLRSSAVFNEVKYIYFFKIRQIIGKELK
jgi:hypothetical protein